MDNAGGHGTDEAWEAFTKDLEVSCKVWIIRQCRRSLETHLFDLGIWVSIQAAVEKAMYMKRGDIHALANAVNDDWDTQLSEKTYKNVYDRLHNVLVMIDDDKRGNAKVEEKRGASFSPSSNFTMTLHLMSTGLILKSMHRQLLHDV
jgi:hypothetical protein